MRFALANHPSWCRRTRAAGAWCCAVLLGGAVAAAGGASLTLPIGPRPPRCEALLINGGGRPRINYQSHLLHIIQLHALLRDLGMAPGRVTVFNADGDDPGADLAVREVQREPDFWLIQGTRLEQHLRPQLRYRSSVIPDVVLRPATPEALQAWFEAAAERLRPGDTILLYVTDHGDKNEEDTANNTVVLWGSDASLSVDGLRQMLSLIDPGVRVVMLMSQCYSGAFANLMYHEDAAVPGNVCGYFASTADRPAYGCYPENRDKDNVGHSFRFIDALRAAPLLDAAHERVLVSDRTPDVPLKTSVLYLADCLEAAAAEQGLARHELIDPLLRQAWQDKARWEPQIRLLDRIGQAFGYFSPRSLSELEQQATLLPDISDKFSVYHQAWQAALDSLARAHLDRFLLARPEWEERLIEEVLAALDDTQRPELTRALVADLRAYEVEDPGTAERLQVLKQKAEAAQAARYRMQVRLGVVQRMEMVLTDIAGQVFLETQGTPAQRDAYQSLLHCEALSLGSATGGGPLLTRAEPFPSYEEELALADAVLPGWMGIRFRPAPEVRRAEFGLPDGAVSIVVVYPDSAASAAGLEVGDIIAGPPDAPFDERDRIREWVMTAPIGVPQTLLVQRGSERLQIELTPRPFPLAWPELPGPPKVGDPAPSLEPVEAYRGTVPDDLAQGGPYLLYFWATWCAPCKAALPELDAFERQRRTQVIAITDELPAQLDSFFARHQGPFPDAVAWDELRRSFLAYAVSGTPGFVLVGADGKIQRIWTGYRPAAGLAIPGWSWSGRPATTDPPAALRLEDVGSEFPGLLPGGPLPPP